MPQTANDWISLLQVITGATFGLGILSLGLALVYFRRSRQGAYWRKRRQSSDRGLRYGFVTVFFLGMSGALCMITVSMMLVEGDDKPADPSAGLPPTETSTPQIIVITPSATPSPADSAMPGLDESPLASPSPSLTPSTEPSGAVSIEPSPTQPRSLAATLEIRALDDVISDNWQAIQPAEAFPAGTERIYVFFAFAEMPQGIRWEQVLLKDGEIIQQETQQWGVTETRGMSYFFFGDSAGFSPGVYEVQFSVENTLLAEANFTITAP